MRGKHAGACVTRLARCTERTDLDHTQVIAVDLEAHQAFSYNELICLIQLAGHGKCFIVDSLALHDSLHVLKPALEDPNILKLLHGSRGDVQWLQALDIFLCNVLDTCELAIVRSAPSFELFRRVTVTRGVHATLRPLVGTGQGSRDDQQLCCRRRWRPDSLRKQISSTSCTNYTVLKPTRTSPCRIGAADH